ncbi:MAG TPA: hypothetical protein PK819_11240, partial [Thermomicrobiales bacterium]|nr:hypothetical protein [Thermomicrobiales bacterium]
MNEHRFDAFTRTIARHTSNRRTFLKAAAISNAAVVSAVAGNHLLLGPIGVAAQDNQRRAAGQPDIAKLAFDLEYDVDQIFAFVASQIVYEPYSGALRGPVGTLWGKAGNSVDQALLLQSLLNEAQVSNQLVVGTLNPDVQQQLVAGLQVSFDDWSQQFLSAVGPDSLGETDAPIAGTPVAATVDYVLAKAAANAQLLQDTVKTQLDEQSQLLATQLAD